MRITGELRKWGYGFCGDTHDVVTAIADRIDAECENACAEAYGNGVMSVPIALDESAWVELPKDADDVPWNVGDRDEDGNVVTQLRLSSDGWYAITDGPSAFHPEQRRHYHNPTVEDVLTEMFAKAIERGELTNGAAQTIAEYAAKLKLAEGEDA